MRTRIHPFTPVRLRGLSLIDSSSGEFGFVFFDANGESIRLQVPREDARLALESLFSLFVMAPRPEVPSIPDPP
jgi:hypothetical protein